MVKTPNSVLSTKRDHYLKHIASYFHPLENVDRGSETQL